MAALLKCGLGSWCFKLLQGRSVFRGKYSEGPCCSSTLWASCSLRRAFAWKGLSAFIPPGKQIQHGDLDSFCLTVVLSIQIILCQSMGFWVSTPLTLLCFWYLLLEFYLGDTSFVHVLVKLGFSRDLCWFSFSLTAVCLSVYLLAGGAQSLSTKGQD